MAWNSFYNRASKAYHDHPNISKLLLVLAARFLTDPFSFLSCFLVLNSIIFHLMIFIVMICSGGGLVASTNGKSLYPSAFADAVHQDDDWRKKKKKKVVVLGTGWAGTSFLKNLKSSSYDVHVISPHNYFAFTPLLPSVTCGTVEARSIVEPIRSITKKVLKFVATLFFLTVFCQD